MQESGSNGSTTTARRRAWTTEHRSLLSNIDERHASSSEDSPAEEVEEEVDEGDQDEQPVIGISIGREQTRLAAPETPAVEKAAAIKDDPFDKALKEQVERLRTAPSDQDLRQDSEGAADPFTGLRQNELPSPWRSEAALDGSHTSSYRQRPRASTGPGASIPEKPQRKLLTFSIPSISKLVNPSRLSVPSIESTLSWLRPGSTTSEQEQSVPSNSRPRSKTSVTKSRDDISGAAPSLSTGETGSELTHNSSTNSDPRPPPILRRTTSDQSLQLLRQNSRASSLGDDSRWHNVHDQVNVRFKAIRDSFVDSNIRLPRIRPSWFDSSNPKQSDPRAFPTYRPTRSNSSGRLSEGVSQTSSNELPNPEISAPPGTTKGSTVSHPQFATALKNLKGDVVVLGGYRGSILRLSEPPFRQCWVPIKVGLNLRKVDLEAGWNLEDDEKMITKIFPDGMLKNIGPVDISRRLFRRLRSCKNALNGDLRVWDYGYDWRLNPHLLSKQLEEYLERLPCNGGGLVDQKRGAIIIAHSLGGLITRHVVNRRPDLFSGVVYAGVPNTCVNILGPLRNGDDVLISSRVLTAQVNLSIRTSFALLPLDGKCFVDSDTEEEYPVDFFDPKTWEEYRLSPCIARPSPPHVPPPEPQQGLVSNIVNSMSNVLPSVASTRRASNAKRNSTQSPQRKSISATTKPQPDTGAYPHSRPLHVSEIDTQMDHLKNPQEYGQKEENAPGTIVTVSKDTAKTYLASVLEEVKRFKQELSYNPCLSSSYPPTAVIYGKSIPTVCGAKVKGREGIQNADAYDNLQFASGDGVVLAKAAQLPQGYRVVRGGAVSSDRGHISLLGDLEAVGACLNAVKAEQRSKEKRCGKTSDGSEFSEIVNNEDSNKGFGEKDDPIV